MRRTLLAVLLAAVALVAAACGSPSPSASGGAGGAGGSAGGAQSLTLNYGQVSDSIAFFPVYVAQQKGYFAAEHLTVGPNPVPILGTGAKVAAALAGGSIDVGGSVMTDAFNLSKAGQNPQVIGAMVNAYYIDIVTGAHAHVAPQGASLIEKVKALKGLKIGMTGPGSGTEALITYLFKLAGMNPQTDATLVNLGGNGTAVLDALQSGRVDAVSFAQPLGQQATLSGVGSIYISPARGDIPSLTGEVQGVVFTDSSVLSSKKPAIQAFVTGVAKAESFIHTAPAGALGTLLKGYLPSLTPKMIAAILPLLKTEIPSSPAVSTSGYQAAVNFHKTAGLFPDPPSYNSLIDSSLISAATAAAGS
jgi:ABC-type nitrate/sulfonate/bicarbonate transport system substrate-binding protein